ncbi:bifunctional UDP-N-acetylglucosamine diphosphorylase/glucosamine-1-phosphate N-acetyltransferase GlmU [uncultured Parvibaculum sp.]|uniref:bifunctional UDP-N-acetylglucosamine diphosphorylase/glucosamine-1-phosphate N-acetyltransferase GlmU n=1 Tax=uncultured Parvibaculum sp. TaxID=291828 RepID=UPI0030DC74EB|tara:strand:+ start:16061 stop:17425 length:1365 start_codon:yes stop_codon:yes gene_type:complete
MTRSDVSTVILAAGKGTRMKSRLPKVLHAIAGRPMLGHVLAAVEEAGVTQSVLVLAPDMDVVASFARSIMPKVSTVIQAAPKGTGDAVRAAEATVGQEAGVVLVVFGDTPLVRSETLSQMIENCTPEIPVVVLGFEAANPAPYGRLILDEKGMLTRIVEAKDATPVEREIRLCNGGAMAVRREHLFRLLSLIGNDNASGEYYLPDVVGHARADGLQCAVVHATEEEIQGVNSRAELAAAEAAMQRRLRQSALDAGVTMLDPDTVYLSFDTRLDPDVTIGQNVVFGPGVKVAEGASIKAFSHIEGATISEGAEIGPFARIRPGSEIGRKAKVGNFVETKKAKVEEGAKISHLSYIGDARVGAYANIGAGTITCNYDGYNKFFTDIGAGAFVGSNSALVAPLRIGEGAYIGSGSVITKDVPADALAVGRGRQFEKSGWAVKFRAAHGNTNEVSSGE